MKLENHKKFDHTSSNGIEYPCKKCDFIFQTKTDFKVHITGMQHNKEIKEEKYEEFTDSDDSEDSIDNEDNVEEEDIDYCNFCGKLLYSYDEYDYHTSNYLRCYSCGICYHNEFQFKRHEECDI